MADSFRHTCRIAPLPSCYLSAAIAVTVEVRALGQTHRPATVFALLLTIFMAAMEMTVVSTAMPTVVAELGGAMHYAWVFTAYMLTSTITVPIYGKLADLYGRKPVMFIAMALFLAGSMASGQARTMTHLIVFRAIQGVGAGGMQPIAITIVGDIFKLEERAKMQGLVGAVWAIAGLVGPLVGGILVASLSWRWVFYVNVPFGLVSAIVLWLAFVESVEKRRHTLDLAGAVLLSSAVVALLLGNSSVAPLLLVPLSVVFTIALLVVERRVQEPLVPLALFATPTLATSSAIFALSGGAMVGLVTFVPLYAQGVLGMTPTAAGMTITPMAIGWPIASVLSGRLIKEVGFRVIVRMGTMCLALASLALVFAIAEHERVIWIVSACFGVGMGLANTALILAVQSSVGFSERGVATASTAFFRNIGSTVSVGVMGAVLARALYAAPAAQGAGGASFVAHILGPDRKRIAPEILQSIAGDLARGITHVMWLIAALATTAAATALFFPDVQTIDKRTRNAPRA